MAVYANLKDYFQGEHLDLIKASISEYCSEHQYTGEADSVQVQKLRCLYKKKIPDISSDIEIEAGVSVQFVDREDNSDSAERFLLIHISGDLRLKLRDIEVSVIKEIDESEMPEESIYDQFLIQKAGPDDMERIYKEFCKLSSGKPPSFDIILKNLPITIYYADFDDTCLGRLNLSESDIDIYTLDKTGNKLVLAGNKARYGTIILNKRKYYDEKDGEYLITVCHELVHWQFHQKFFKILMLLGNTEDALNYKAQPPIYNESMNDSQKALCIAEWQANELSWSIVMPKISIDQMIELNDKILADNKYPSSVIPDLKVAGIAYHFHVSPYVAKIRLRQLGYDFADGTCLEIDGKRYLPFAFAPGWLKQNETFVIDRANYERLLREDKDFADFINTSRYIYLGYVVCLLDSKYLDVRLVDNKVEFDLSEYARYHAEKCCLKFIHRSWYSPMKESSVYLGGYLNKEDFNNNSEYYFNARSQNEDGENKELSTFMKNLIDSRIDEDYEKRNDELIVSEMKKNMTTFGKALKYVMEKHRSSIVTNEKLAEFIDVNTKTISNWRNDKSKPDSLEKVMLICLCCDTGPTIGKYLIEKSVGGIPDDGLKKTAYELLLKYTNTNLDYWNMILERFNLKPIMPK